MFLEGTTPSTHLYQNNKFFFEIYQLERFDEPQNFQLPIGNPSPPENHIAGPQWPSSRTTILATRPMTMPAITAAKLSPMRLQP